MTDAHIRYSKDSIRYSQSIRIGCGRVIRLFSFILLLPSHPFMLACVGRMSIYGVKYLSRKAREGLYVISSQSITKKSYDDNMQINFSTQIKRNKTSTLIFSLGSFLLASWNIYKGSCISLHQSVYLKISVLVCWSVKQ